VVLPEDSAGWEEKEGEWFVKGSLYASLTRRGTWCINIYHYFRTPSSKSTEVRPGRTGDSEEDSRLVKLLRKTKRNNRERPGLGPSRIDVVGR